MRAAATSLLTAAQAVGLDGYRGCGIGEGARCCAFLVVGALGFECARGSEVHDEILRRVAVGLFTARRRPGGAFPSCQAEGR